MLGKEGEFFGNVRAAAGCRPIQLPAAVNIRSRVGGHHLATFLTVIQSEHFGRRKQSYDIDGSHVRQQWPRGRRGRTEPQAGHESNVQNLLRQRIQHRVFTVWPRCCVCQVRLVGHQVSPVPEALHQCDANLPDVRFHRAT